MTTTEIRSLEEQLQTAVLPVRFSKTEGVYRTYDNIFFSTFKLGEELYIDFAEMDYACTVEKAIEAIALLRRSK